MPSLHGTGLEMHYRSLIKYIKTDSHLLKQSEHLHSFDMHYSILHIIISINVQLLTPA